MLDELAELLESRAPVGGELLVVPLFLKKHLDEPEGQRPVGAGPYRYPLGLRLAGRRGSIRAW